MFYIKNLLRVCSLLIPLALISCEEKEITKVPAKMKMENADELGLLTMEFSSKSTSQTVNFTADGPWKAILPAADWLTVSPTSGTGSGQITISVQANSDDKKGRSAQIYFNCGGLDQKDFIMVNQEQLYIRKLIFPGTKGFVPSRGGSFIGNVSAVFVEKWKVTSSASWLKVEQTDKTHIKVTATKNEGTVRTAKVTLESIGLETSLSHEAEFFQYPYSKADVLDVEFSENGAKDLAQDREIRYVEGNECLLAKNDVYGTWVPTFTHNMGGDCTAGIFRTNIDESMKQALNDGFTMEAVVMLKDAPNGKEIKAFTSTKSGGLGLMVNSSGNGNDLCFLLNNGGWNFVGSKVIPEPGVYYHLVGTWDQAAGEAKVYVNGELKNTKEVKGNIKYGSLNPNFFGIGANSASDILYNGSWKGDVVSAKIFNDPLTEEQVKGRYHDNVPAVVYSD